jgi:hypothetical protein
MKSVHFWKIEIKQLSLSERMFFRDAIRTLQEWPLLNDECLELNVVKRILESEIRLQEKESGRSRKWWATDLNVKLLPSP